MILMGMEIPLEAIRQQIASGIDIIVHLGRLRDKTRKVLEIVEVCGFENGEIVLSPLYRFEEEGETGGGKFSAHFERKESLPMSKSCRLPDYADYHSLSGKERLRFWKGRLWWR